jgi:uncharacterized protein
MTGLAEAAVRRWVDSVVVGLKLCPFAERELDAGRVQFVVTAATSQESLLLALNDELERLRQDSSVETTLLIHPQVLGDFMDYNDFLGVVDQFLKQNGYEGEFQVASFHPDYQFDGTAPDDVQNYTNRAPHPVLHLIREESLTQALENYPDVDQVPIRNIETMRRFGVKTLQKLLSDCG